MDLAGERDVLPLGRVADAVALATPHLGDQAEAARIHLGEQAAVVQRMQQPKTHPLAEARTRHHVAEAERLARRLEGAEDLGRVYDRLDDVGLPEWLGHLGPPRNVGCMNGTLVMQNITWPSSPMPTSGGRPGSGLALTLLILYVSTMVISMQTRSKRENAGLVVAEP